MKTNVLVVLLALSSLVLMTSCQSKTGDKKTSPAKVETIETSKIKGEIISIINSLPSNTETVNLINSTGASYLAGFTREDLKTENLLTRAEKAQTYGTIIFDLAYTNTYNQVESFSKLLNIYETLTRELGFEELVNAQKDFKEHYQKNKDNQDSLDILVTGMLNKTNKFIQDNGSAVDLSLVFAGAVAKSLNVISYITLFSTDKAKLIELLQKQKQTVNSTCDILKMSPEDANASKLYQLLSPVNDLFNNTPVFTEKTVDEISKLTAFISQ